MTLKECLAAMRAEKLVALPAGGVLERGEDQNHPVKTAVSSGSANMSMANTADSASDSHIYPRKPDDSCGQSEIYPTSTRIYPSTPIKLVQGDIFFGDVQADPEKNDSHTERVGPLGEIRVDAGVLRIDREKGVGEIGENGPEMEVCASPPPQKPKKPFLTAGGDLSIPFDCDPRYHWWMPGGQSAKETKSELLAALEAGRHQAPDALSANSESSPRTSGG